MGAGYHGGFGNTNGNKLHQFDHAIKQKTSLHQPNEKDNKVSFSPLKDMVDENIVSEMEKTHVKFSKEALVFATRDKTGQIIFLEAGTEDAGLKHIQQRHSREFYDAFSVKKEDIPHFLYAVVREGNIVDDHIEIRNGRKTVTKVYDYQGNYYILAGVGTNGFIVTARPAKKE